VIATSCGAASTYIKEGYTNLRLGMFLEVATTIGAIVGALIATFVSVKALTVVLAIVLLYSAYLSQQPKPEHASSESPDPLATRMRLNNTCPTADGLISYQVHSVPVGFSVMLIAGVLSGLLGIGSGAFKVLAMDQAMRLPFKVSTTTSNFMIGVTAATSAVIYFQRGYVDPRIAIPTALGVLFGAQVGSRLGGRARSSTLRLIFRWLLALFAIIMLYRAVQG
jgi:uncharacterized membrane protein YfcA